MACPRPPGTRHPRCGLRAASRDVGERRRQRAARLMHQGAELLDTDRRAAERCYRKAVSLDPELHEAWFDLGLIYKWRRDWVNAFECNLRAAELVGEVAEEPAWWNLGIAATALRRWEVARRAWRAYGVSLPEGSGPIEADLGTCPVRILPEAEAEVVWGRRVDPARVVLASVPFPSSGHRWGDYVLHDGSPNGERILEGRTYAVFDELERWQPSDVPTLEADVDVDDEDDVRALVEAVEAAGFVAEDWTANVQMLCRDCSEGTVHGHDRARFDAGRQRVLGLAGSAEEITAIVERWAAEAAGRRCERLEVGL